MELLLIVAPHAYKGQGITDKHAFSLAEATLVLSIFSALLLMILLVLQELGCRKGAYLALCCTPFAIRGRSEYISVCWFATEELEAVDGVVL